MAGFMRLTVYRASYADFAPETGGFAETREIDTVDSSEGLQQVSDAAEGWFARYSAPGYLDQTDSAGPFEDPETAAIECFKLFGDDSQIFTPDSRELVKVLREIRNS